MNGLLRRPATRGPDVDGSEDSIRLGRGCTRACAGCLHARTLDIAGAVDVASGGDAGRHRFTNAESDRGAGS